MKTSSRNITKLRVALQNMNSGELLQMATPGIVIIFTTSNGYLQTSLKMRFIMWLKLQKQPLNAVIENLSFWNYRKTCGTTKIQVTVPIEISSKAAVPLFSKIPYKMTLSYRNLYYQELFYVAASGNFKFTNKS